VKSRTSCEDHIELEFKETDYDDESLGRLILKRDLVQQGKKYFCNF
jgi:hypothetical protein